MRLSVKRAGSRSSSWRSMHLGSLVVQTSCNRSFSRTRRPSSSRHRISSIQSLRTSTLSPFTRGKLPQRLVLVRLSRLCVLPGVGLGGFSAGPGPDLVEPPESLVREGYLQGPQAPGQLLHGARPDDRGRDDGVVQQPGQRDVGGPLAELLTERLVGLELRAMLLDLLLHLRVGPAAFARLPQGTR